MEVFFVMTQGRTSCCQVSLLIVSLGKGAAHWRETELWRKQGCSDYTSEHGEWRPSRYVTRWWSGPERDSTVCAKGSAPMFRANVEIPLGLWKGTTCGFVHKEHALCISLLGMKLCPHQTTQSPEVILRWCSAHHSPWVSDGVGSLWTA